MAGSRFREEGSTWPELVRSMVFCYVKGKQTLPGTGNRVKQGMEVEKADQRAGNTSCLCSQVVEAVENQADELGFSFICNKVSPTVSQPKVIGGEELP